MEGEAVLLAVVGVMASMAGVLVWLIKKQFEQNSTQIENNQKIQSESNAANLLLATSINNLSNAADKQVKAIEEGQEEQRKFQESVLSQLGSIKDDTTAIRTINQKEVI